MNYKYYTSNNNGQDDYGLKYIDDQGYGLICKDYRIEFPPQHQDSQPGMEYLMRPRPIFNNPYYRGSGKLMNKVAIITGGDSGIGRAGHPYEIAPLFIYLASDDSSYVTGQVMHINGGEYKG